MNGSPPSTRIGDIIDAHKISGYQILVLVLCFLIVLMDGSDVAVIGYIAPALRQEWTLTSEQLAPAFGAGLFGLMGGSLVFGPLADRFGRKRVILISLLIFGSGTLASAWSASILCLAALRFLTGLGLGGAMPTCITMSSEFTPLRRRMLLVTLSFSGFTAGLAFGGLIAGELLPVFGWRGVLAFGGIVPLVLLPILAWLLPESIRFLASDPRRADALHKIVARITGSRAWDRTTITPDDVQARQASAISQLFIGGTASRTLLLWVAFFCSLFVFYLLTSWLPTILRDSGFAIGGAAKVSAMVPIGGTVGAIALALVMDKRGKLQVLALSYLASGAGVAAIGLVLGHVNWLLLTVFLVGFCIAGAQNGLNLLAATIYPTTARATGVSWALAAGRVGSIAGSMVGGWLMAVAGHPIDFFQIVAAPCIVGSAALFVMHRLPRPTMSANAVVT